MPQKPEQELIKVRNAFAKQDVFRLRELSNEAIREASLNNDSFMAEIAIAAYALHKLSTKEHITKSRNWERIRKNILRALERSVSLVNSAKIEEFEGSLRATIDSVRSADSELGYFTQNLYDKARIKLASTAYSLGLSLSQAVELTHADKSKVLPYIGGTKIYDEEMYEKGISERLAEIKKKMVLK